MKAAAPRARPPGFSLVEVLLVLLLFTLLALLLTGAFLGLQRTMTTQAVVCDAEVLAESPSFSPMPAALELHRLFLSRLRDSSAVYVFGGRNLDVGEAQRSLPLARRDLPVFGSFSNGLPLSAEAFQSAYAEALGEPEASPGESDFSVLVLGPVGGVLAPTCLVQCRSRQFLVPQQESPWLRRETILVDREFGALRYAFAEPCADHKPSYVGALHSWCRRKDAQGVGEEGPAHVVFPDPWLFRGTDVTGRPLAGESHFSYLLAVGR